MSNRKNNYKQTDIEKIFNNLLNDGGSTKTLYLAANLPFSRTHKIGVSCEGYPVFFIQSSITGNVPSINLDLISVQYAQLCNLKIREGKSEQGTYTIFRLKSLDPDLVGYFINIVCLVLQKIGENPKQQTLIDELKKLVDLFRLFSSTPLAPIQGLWAELFLIHQSSNPDYLIRSWHVTVNDIFDFNDGHDKIEVKSTAKPNRIHHFSNEQLHPNEGSGLVICSVMMTKAGQGLSVFDLKVAIEERIENENRFRLNELFAKTLGTDYYKALETFFDYQSASDSFKIFNYSSIPAIDNDTLPSEISNLHYDSDLSDIEEASASYLSEHELFKGLR